MPTVDATKSVESEYSRLAIRERELRLLIESGEHKCTRCQKAKKNHVNDGRCTNSCLSASFASEEDAELEHVSNALTLIESLRQVGC